MIFIIAAILCGCAANDINPVVPLPEGGVVLIPKQPICIQEENLIITQKIPILKDLEELKNITQTYLDELDNYAYCDPNCAGDGMDPTVDTTKPKVRVEFKDFAMGKLKQMAVGMIKNAMLQQSSLKQMVQATPHTKKQITITEVADELDERHRSTRGLAAIAGRLGPKVLKVVKPKLAALWKHGWSWAKDQIGNPVDIIDAHKRTQLSPNRNNNGKFDLIQEEADRKMFTAFCQRIIDVMQQIKSRLIKMETDIQSVQQGYLPADLFDYADLFRELETEFGRERRASNVDSLPPKEAIEQSIRDMTAYKLGQVIPANCEEEHCPLEFKFPVMDRDHQEKRYEIYRIHTLPVKDERMFNNRWHEVKVDFEYLMQGPEKIIYPIESMRDHFDVSCVQDFQPATSERCVVCAMRKPFDRYEDVCANAILKRKHVNDVCKKVEVENPATQFVWVPPSTFAYADITPGTMAMKCRDVPTMQMFNLPYNGMFTVQPMCVYNITNGPFPQDLPFPNVKLSYYDGLSSSAKLETVQEAGLEHFIHAVNQFGMPIAVVFLSIGGGMLTLVITYRCLMTKRRIKRTRRSRRIRSFAGGLMAQ